MAILRSVSILLDDAVTEIFLMYVPYGYADMYNLSPPSEGGHVGKILAPERSLALIYM